MRKLFRLPFLPILAAPFVLLSPVLLAGKALFWGTPMLQFVPWHALAWEILRSGHLPLWNPLVGMGAPLLANYQSALLYPPTWLLFLLQTLGGIEWAAWGQALLIAMHLAWAGAGMALLARWLGLNDLAQTISGLAFGLCGYLVARAGFLSFTTAAAWLPWILFFTGRLATAESQSKRFPTVGGLSICLGMQLLAGHAQTAWYSLLLAGGWAAYWGWGFAHSQVQIGAQPFKLTRLWGVIRALGWLILALGIGVALSAAQLLPTAEYLLQSQRASAVDYNFAMTYSFWPWRFLTLLAPSMFGSPVQGNYWGYGNYWEDTLYLGVLPLILGLAAILRRRSRAHMVPHPVQDDSGKLHHRIMPSFPWFLFALTLISFAFALGKNTPLFPWLYQHVPTFDMFQAPTRFSLWAEFALALLAGIGVDGWRRPQSRSLYWTRLGTAGAFAVTLGAGLTWYLMGQVSPTFIRATALAGMWGMGTGLLSLVAPDTSVTLSMKWSRLWPWAVTLFVMADLLVADWGLNPGIESAYYRQLSPTANQVRAMAGEGRLYLSASDEYDLKYKRFFQFRTFNPAEDWLNARAIMLPNMGLLDGIPSANNFDPLVPGRYARWMEGVNDLQTRGANEAFKQLLNLMGVGVVEKMDTSGNYGVRFTTVEESGRLHWLSCARSARDEQDSWDQVFGNRTNLKTEVIIEGLDLSQIPECLADGSFNFEISAEEPNRLAVHIRSDSDGWLMLSDVWYPGWVAQVDGVSQPILRADYLFQAVHLVAGEHEVVFEYRSIWFYTGCLISGLAILGLAGYSFKAANRRQVVR